VSYDLVVFEPTAAPREPKAFLAWFAERAESGPRHDHADPAVTSSALRTWFDELTATFPPATGPYPRIAADEDPMTADYSLRRELIYARFPPGKSRQAYGLAKSVAARVGVGLYDVSSLPGQVWLPDGRGGLLLQHRDEDRAHMEAMGETSLATLLRLVALRLDDESRRDLQLAIPQATKLGQTLAGQAGLGEEEAAVWVAEALACLLDDLEGAAAAGQSRSRAVLLPYRAKPEGLRAVSLGERWTVEYPRSSPERKKPTYILLPGAVSATFALTLGSLERGLRTAAYREPRKLAESTIGAAATAVLGRDIEFVDGKLVDWKEWLYPTLDWLFVREAYRVGVIPRM
jgi:hypothetical protein